MTEDSAFKYLKKTGSIFVKANIIVNNKFCVIIERYHSFSNARKCYKKYKESGYDVDYTNKTQAEKVGWYDVHV